MASKPTFAESVFDRDQADPVDRKVGGARQKMTEDEALEEPEGFEKRMFKEPGEEDLPGTEDTEDTFEDVLPDDEDSPAGDDDEPRVKSPTLLARAFNVGMSMEDANAFRSAADLERAVALMERSRTGGTQPPKPEQEEPTDEYSPLALEFEDHFDEDAKGVFEKIVNHVNESLAKLYGKTKEAGIALQDLSARSAAASAMQTRAVLDGWFKNHSDFYGSTSTDELPNESRALSRRTEVIEEMGRMNAGYRARGEQPPPLRQLFDRAIRAVHGDRVRVRKEGGPGQRPPRDDSGRFSTPPQSRQKPRPTNKTGEKAAIENVAKRLKAMRIGGSRFGV